LIGTGRRENGLIGIGHRKNGLYILDELKVLVAAATITTV